MKVYPGLADKEWMARGCFAKVLVHRERIVNRASCQLPVHAEFCIDVGIDVQAQTVAHTRVLLMSQRRKPRGRRRVGLAKDAVETQTKVATKTQPTNREHPALDFFYA